MVFKTLTSFSRYSSTKTNASHSFFDPSYMGQQKVTVFDGVLGTSSKRHSSTAHPHHTIASSSASFIVFDPSFLHGNNNNNNNNNANTNDKEKRIWLKKASHKVNKNGHVNISVDSISDQFTTLTLRKSNATTSKTIKISKSEFVNANFKPSLRPVPAMAPAPVAMGSSPGVAQEEKTLLPSSDEDVPLSDEAFLRLNHQMMNNFRLQGKSNEIVAIYNRVKERRVIPSVAVYNMVLESIPLRTHVQESLEENLTLLMSVYSDMLSNGVKPNDSTLELTILPLLNGCMDSFLRKDVAQGEQYFKIAEELFNVATVGKSSFQPEVYEKLLVCYNLTKHSGVDVESFAKLIASKLGKHNILYYLGLINLCKHSHNYKFVLELYSEYKSMASPQLLQHQLQVYSSLIRVLISCNQVEASAKILDALITSFRSESGMQKDIAPLISSFIVGLADVGLISDAYKTLEKFDAIPWLPKLPVNSLMILIDRSCDANEFQYALKFWDFAVVRSDFDSSIIQTDNNMVNLLSNSSSIETKSTFAKLVQLAFLFGNKLSLVRLSKEMLLKDSLSLELPLLTELVKFLFNHGLSGLAMQVVYNQGFKLDESTRVNTYLSSVIDLIPVSNYKDLVGSSLYKSAVDNYSLIDDSIYCIYKTLSELKKQGTVDEGLAKKLNYYEKILLQEFDDLNNFYVEIPAEIEHFKAQLKVSASA